MKITKAQLKNIIAEELEALGEPPVDQAAEEIEKLAVRALRTVYYDLKKSYALEDDPSTALKVVEAMLERTRSKSSLEEIRTDGSGYSPARIAASKALSMAGIARRPEAVRAELMDLVAALDPQNPKDIKAVADIVAQLMDAAQENIESGHGLEELNAMDKSDEAINEMEAEVVGGLTPENIQIVLLGLKKLALETGLPLAALTAAAMKIHQRIDPKSSKDES
jgi:hypothetical protein